MDGDTQLLNNLSLFAVLPSDEHLVNRAVSLSSALVILADTGPIFDHPNCSV